MQSKNNIEVYMIVDFSPIIIYKIVKDYEATGRTSFFKTELYDFVDKVISHTIKNTNELYSFSHTAEAKKLCLEKVSTICDVSPTSVEINDEKLNSLEGQKLISSQIDSINHPCLEACRSILNEEISINNSLL